MANYVAETFGYTAPFMMAVIFLIAGATVIQYSWTENYGQREAEPSNSSSLYQGFIAVKHGMKADRNKVVVFAELN